MAKKARKLGAKTGIEGFGKDKADEYFDQRYDLDNSSSTREMIPLTVDEGEAMMVVLSCCLSVG